MIISQGGRKNNYPPKNGKKFLGLPVGTTGEGILTK
jgi:hypothetical protein